jgi:hypothetical protein
MFRSLLVGAVTVTVSSLVLIGLATQHDPPVPHVRLPDRGSHLQASPGSSLEGLEQPVQTVRYFAAVHTAQVRQAEEQRLAVEAQVVAEATSSAPAQSEWVASAPSEGHTPCAIPAYICERESGGDPTIWNSEGSGASGKYQAMHGTWGGYAGYENAADAPEEIQDEWAALLWDGGNGCSHWSAC